MKKIFNLFGSLITITPLLLSVTSCKENIDDMYLTEEKISQKINQYINNIEPGLDYSSIKEKIEEIYIKKWIKIDNICFIGENKYEKYFTATIKSIDENYKIKNKNEIK